MLLGLAWLNYLFSVIAEIIMEQNGMEYGLVSGGFGLIFSLALWVGMIPRCSHSFWTDFLHRLQLF